MSSEFNQKKIIITRRTWQLMVSAGLVLLIMSARYYPFDPHYGLRLGGLIFTIVLGLTFLREERRATQLPNSNWVVNWNLIEAVSLFLFSVSFYVVAFIFHLSEMYFYAYLHTGILGLLAGVGAGEFFWQNIRLKELEEVCQNRYWACYKNSIF